VKIVVLDVETGGLDPNRHCILELGACVWEDGVISSEDFSLPIYEGGVLCYNADAMRINKIDLGTWSEIGVSPAEAVEQFEKWLDKHELADGVSLGGHNVGFDVAFLKRLYRLAKAKYTRFDHHLLDTASLLQFMNLRGVYCPLGLNQAIKFFGVEQNKNKHRALHDALATARLLTKLTKL
jgi:DNA polymerase-3 subunit epsilon